jgi:outer membrane protein OmpA-like peptidoglycan-associated protein
MISLVWKSSRFIVPIIVAAILGSHARANVVGADTQNFNPTNDGLDFVTVHSSETLTPGLLNIGLFLNYAVNSLPNYTDQTTGSRTNFEDALLSSDLNFALGLMHGWEVGMSYPVLLSQSVDSDVSTFRGEFAETGITEFRLFTKFRFAGDQDGGMGVVLSANFNQIEDNPFQGEGAGPTYNFELVGDTTVGKYALGANVGYRYRNPGDQLPGVPIEPYGDQYIASTAVSYLVTDWDTKIIAELFGSVPVKESQSTTDRDDSSLEFLLGMKTDITPSLAFHAGGGTEVFQGTSSPDWRVYTGINWVIGPLFSKPKDVFVKVEDQPLKSLEDMDAADPFEGTPQLTEAFIARDVLFEFNSDQLQPAGLEALSKLVAYLKKPPYFQSLTIEGHTDSVGSALYNLDLSQRRADSARRALIKMGLPGNKIKAMGFGESRPIANNGNYQGRAMNRRVEFKVKRSTGDETIRSH